MQRYKAIIEYDGSSFCGWQKQNNALSVQQALETAITAFTGYNAQVYAAGRTDAGVHAIAQVVHFDLPKFYNPFTVTNAINFHLRPHRISALSTEAVDESFHARFSALRRYYRYQIRNRHSPLALDVNRYWHVDQYLDDELMHQAAQYLVGTHDFTSFRATQCQAESPVKTIDRIVVSRNEDIIYFDLVAQSFLHHMVRNIVGTLKMIGDNKIPVKALPNIIAARDRGAAGMTAPACGLYFMKVDY